MADETPRKELSPWVVGSFGGLAAACVSHPIDTLKVRAQAGSHKGNMFKGLFSGFLTPICTVTPQWSALQTGLVFGFQNSPPDAWWRPAFAGFTAAMCCSIVYCPMQSVKCTAQVHRLTSLQALKKVYEFGGIRYGLYRGYLPSLAFELPGYAVFFSIYDYVKRNGTDGDDFSLLLNFKAALAASLGESTVGMPGDTVRSRYQTNFGHKSPYACARDLLRSEGIRGFYRGYQYRLAFGAVVNGAALGTIEFINKWWTSQIILPDYRELARSYLADTLQGNLEDK